MQACHKTENSEDVGPCDSITPILDPSASEDLREKSSSCEQSVEEWQECEDEIQANQEEQWMVYSNGSQWPCLCILMICLLYVYYIYICIVTHVRL